MNKQKYYNTQNILDGLSLWLIEKNDFTCFEYYFNIDYVSKYAYPLAKYVLQGNELPDELPDDLIDNYNYISYYAIYLFNSKNNIIVTVDDINYQVRSIVLNYLFWHDMKYNLNIIAWDEKGNPCVCNPDDVQLPSDRLK